MKFNVIMLLVLLSFGLFIQPLALFAVNDFIFGKYSETASWVFIADIMSFSSVAILNLGLS